MIRLNNKRVLIVLYESLLYLKNESSHKKIAEMWNNWRRIRIISIRNERVSKMLQWGRLNNRLSRMSHETQWLQSIKVSLRKQQKISKLISWTRLEVEGIEEEHLHQTICLLHSKTQESTSTHQRNSKVQTDSNNSSLLLEANGLLKAYQTQASDNTKMNLKTLLGLTELR